MAQALPIYDLDEEIVSALRCGNRLILQAPTGSGKSTLLHLISGLDFPDAGEVLIDGENVGRMKDAGLSAFRNKKIGFIYS
jgi:putative ABC transport system ATP-binding protein